jgi:hypothetical protein
LSLQEAGRIEAALVMGRLAHERIAAVAGESGRETLRLNAALIADSYGRLLDATGNPARAAEVWSAALRSLAAESPEAPDLVQQALRTRLIERLGRKDEAQRLADDLRRSGFADPRPPLPRCDSQFKCIDCLSRRRQLCGNCESGAPRDAVWTAGRESAVMGVKSRQTRSTCEAQVCTGRFPPDSHGVRWDRQRDLTH